MQGVTLKYENIVFQYNKEYCFFSKPTLGRLCAFPKQGIIS